VDETTLAIASILAELNFTGWSIWLTTQKNRDWREGLAMGVMLGPLGVIVAALMPALEYVPVEEQEPPMRAASGDRRDPRLSDAEWARHLSSEYGKLGTPDIVGAKPSPAKPPLTKPCSDAEWERLARDQAISEVPPVKRYTDAEWAKRTPGQGRKPGSN
jgi:hypothetical protein